MRALIHYKNSNLSWCALLKHFRRYASIQNFTTKTPVVNEKICENFYKSFKPIESQSTILNAMKYKQPPNIKSKLDELLNDRYQQQMDVINQFQSEETKCEDVSFNSERLEYTIHSCFKSLRRDLKDLFPDRDIMSEESPLSVVCLNHHTNENMSTWDSSVAEERIALANLVVNSSIEICKSLKNCGFWADFIDPYSGAPYYGPHTNDTLFETDPRMRNFGLEIQDLGCCKVLSHPIWKEHVFTGLIFTNAPADHPMLNLLHNDS